MTHPIFNVGSKLSRVDLKSAKVPWNRCKLMIVGEGGVGKTALCNSMLGIPFMETESTPGVSHMTCTVTNDESRILFSERPEGIREKEAAVAQHFCNFSKESDITTYTDAKPSEDESRSMNAEERKVVPVEVNTESEKSSDQERKTEKSIEGIDLCLLSSYLGDIKIRDCSLVFSLFDFGGQRVFEVLHHLFLTSYGVYVIVFRMDRVINPNEVNSALSNLSYWFNSVVMHTLHNDKPSRIFLVGTCKDLVPESSHKQISDEIKSRLAKNIGWKNIHLNLKNDLCFFPVNNKSGIEDKMVLSLMREIQCCAENEPYVMEPRRISWFQAYDEIRNAGKSYLKLNDVISICHNCDDDELDVHKFLTFLNDMGLILWLDEPGLRNIIIVDVISFFIRPACLIICNHVPNMTEKQVHHKEIQEECKNKHPADWGMMVKNGIVRREFIDILLKTGNTDRETIPVIINMMCNHGLIVRLRNAESCADEMQMHYLVPALLPPPQFCQSFSNVCNKITRSTCYFHFSLTPIMPNVFSMDKMESEGFLPNGLMERLIAKTVTLYRQENFDHLMTNLPLYQNYTKLLLGTQLFCLISLPEINCIRVDIDGDHPQRVHKWVKLQLEKCISECLQSLQLLDLVPYDNNSSHYYLSLEYLRRVDYENPLIVAGECICVEDIRRLYSKWLHDTRSLQSYDVFISYRWGQYDSPLADDLYEKFFSYVVEGCNRYVRVFRDKVRIKHGQHIQKACCDALKNSLIFVPIISMDALEKMENHDPSDYDNVLIEWLFALNCIEEKSRLQVIFPLFVGKRSVDIRTNDILYGKDILDPLYGGLSMLPDIIPQKTLAKVEERLNENKMTLRSSPTVRDIVDKLKSYNGFRFAADPQSHPVLEEACNQIMETLREIISREKHGIAPLAVEISSPTAISVLPPINVAMRDLKSLEVDDIVNLFEKCRLNFISKESIREKCIDGFILSNLENNFTHVNGIKLDAVKCSQLQHYIQRWKSEGVPKSKCESYRCCQVM